MIDVPRISEARLKRIYCEYLEQRGVRATSVATGSRKTPDFELAWSGEKFLNECKAPEMHFHEELGVYKFKTTHSKLLEFCQTAAKQFESIDPERRGPRVLTFISCQMQLNLYSLLEAMQGGVAHPGGGWIATFNDTVGYRRWLTRRGLIDGYIWLQLSIEPGQLFQAGYFTLENGPHERQCRHCSKDYGECMSAQTIAIF